MKWIFRVVLLVTLNLFAAEPNLSCERRIGEMHWEGMIFHRYQLRAENFPPSQKYCLVVESFDGTRTETFTYLSNKRGHLILLPPENVEGDLFAICPAKRGERLTFLMQEEESKGSYATDFIPFPIEKKSKKGAHLSLELQGQKGESFLFFVQGLKVCEEVELTLEFGNEKIPFDSQVTQSGDLCREIHLLEDPKGGEAKLILKRKNEEVIFPFQWGAPALQLVGACCFEIK